MLRAGDRALSIPGSIPGIESIGKTGYLKSPISQQKRRKPERNNHGLFRINTNDSGILCSAKSSKSNNKHNRDLQRDSLEILTAKGEQLEKSTSFLRSTINRMWRSI